MYSAFLAPPARASNAYASQTIPAHNASGWSCGSVSNPMATVFLKMHQAPGNRDSLNFWASGAGKLLQSPGPYPSPARLNKVKTEVEKGSARTRPKTIVPFICAQKHEL